MEMERLTCCLLGGQKIPIEEDGVLGASIIQKGMASLPQSIMKNPLMHVQSNCILRI